MKSCFRWSEEVGDNPFSHQNPSPGPEFGCKYKGHRPAFSPSSDCSFIKQRIYTHSLCLITAWSLDMNFFFFFFLNVFSGSILKGFWNNRHDFEDESQSAGFVFLSPEPLGTLEPEKTNITVGKWGNLFALTADAFCPHFVHWRVWGQAEKPKSWREG